MNNRSQLLGLSVWLIARSIDETGCGVVDYDELKKETEIIWSNHRFYESIKYAKALGIINVFENNEKYISYTGLENVCVKMGIANIGPFSVSVEIENFKNLVSTRSLLYSLFLATTKTIISRNTIQNNTGISVSTQKRYQKRTNRINGNVIKSTRNALKTKYSTDQLWIARETIHGACFVMDDAVFRPLPNNYHTNFKIHSRASCRKINKKLYSLVNKLDAGYNRKTFFSSENAARTYLRKNDTGRNLLHPYETRNYMTLWTAF